MRSVPGNVGGLQVGIIVTSLPGSLSGQAERETLGTRLEK